MVKENTSRGRFKRLRGVLKSYRKLSRRNSSSSKGSLGEASKEFVASDNRSVVSGLTLETTHTVEMDQDTAAAAASSNDDDASKTSTNTTTTNKLKVVLVVVDPKTRRFELVQLKFDPATAQVSHVLDQIHRSVTDPSLRDKTFRVVANPVGDEIEGEDLLSNHCQGNDIVVAVPNELPSKECARVARLVLNHKDVLGMLDARAVDIKEWRLDPAMKKAEKAEQQEEQEKSRSSSATTAPLLPNKGAKTAHVEMAQTDRSLSCIPEEKTFSGSSVPHKTIASLIVMALLALLWHVHASVQAPILPGSVLTPGTWRSKCGLWTFLSPLPLLCHDNAFLFLDRDGRQLSVYKDDYQLEWQITGPVCNDKNDNCVSGLVVHNDSTVYLGGQPVNTAIMYRESDLTPWPFVEKPELMILTRYVDRLAAPKSVLHKLEHLVHREVNETH